jgi:GrpB-like predicted nucleotidyltransferase (UPF0157 family)
MPDTTDTIALAPYDARWPALFKAEQQAIRAALGPDIEVCIVHIGSTAVPDLPAKPISDILLIAPVAAQWSSFIAPLEGLDYVFWPDNPRRDRMFFVKGMPPYGTGRTHHVHVRMPADAQAELRFRDQLRAHPELAAQYLDVKRALATRYRDDREAYTEGKSRFIRELLAAACVDGA